MKKLLLSIIIALSSSASAFAASSPWFDTDGARIRLITLPAADGKTIDAGLQIELQKGWKTYWRSPGASGLPPQLDFGGSKNIAATKLEYPTPTTFGDRKNLTAGYVKSVTLPIAVEPLFPNRPITLSASGLVGICGEVCVPVQFQLSVLEDGKGSSTRDIASALLAAKSSKVQAAGDGFKIMKAIYKNGQLLVAAHVPDTTVKSAVLVEGPSDWYLTPANAKSIENGVAQYSVDLRDIPEGANPLETELRISVVSDNASIEQLVMPTSQ